MAEVPLPDWETLRGDPRLSELDRQLGQLLGALDPAGGAWVRVAGSLASRAAALGEGYLALAGEAPLEPWPTPMLWRERLLGSPVVGAPPGHRPLILDAGDRLYLHRFWCYQADLARDLRERAALPPRRLSEARLQRSLDRLDASVTGFGAVSPLILGTAALCRVCVVQASSSIWADLLSSLLVVIGEQLNRRLSLLVAGPGQCRDLLATLLARVANDPTLNAGERAQLPTEPLVLEHLPRDRYRNRQDGIGQEPPLRADLAMVVGAEAADPVMLGALVRNLPPYTRLVLLGDTLRVARPEYLPFAALLAGPGQSAAFREHLGRLLGEPLARGGDAVNALQNAVVTPLVAAPSVTAGGLYQAFWEPAGGTGNPAHNPEE